MNEFHGMAVGGPYDGRMITHYTPTLLYFEKPNDFLFFADAKEEEYELSYIKKSYRHSEALRGAFTVDLWIDENIKDLGDAFKRIFLFYANNAGRIDEH